MIGLNQKTDPGEPLTCNMYTDYKNYPNLEKLPNDIEESLDELDENNNAYNNTRTLIWNVEDLSNPVVETTYFGPTPSIDHNNYIIGDKVYMSHYTSGLRILDISNISSPTESAFFDVYPANNNTSFELKSVKLVCLI